MKLSNPLKVTWITEEYMKAFTPMVPTDLISSYWTVRDFSNRRPTNSNLVKVRVVKEEEP